MKHICTILIMLLCLGASAQSKPSLTINHLAIYVKDLQVSRNYYEQALGLDTIPEPFHDKKHVWFNIGGGASLHVISGAAKSKEYFQNNHICLSTPDLDAFKALLESRKITWYNMRGEKGLTTTRRDGVLQVWLQDPDGYWIEINNDKAGLARD